jgi:hypothetical protein
MPTKAPHGSSTRVIAAAILSPLVGILALALIMGAGAALLNYGPWSEAVPGMLHASFFLALFGAPGAYLLEALVGVPAYSWLTHRGRLRPVWVIACGACAGTISFGVPFAAAFGVRQPTEVLALFLLGAAGGAVGGATFWLIAFAGVREARAA